MSFAMKRRRIGNNALARAAATSSPVVTRYKKDDTDGSQRDTKILQRLATALGVSFPWLAAGEGLPDDAWIPNPLLERTYELDPRYPNLAEAIRVRRGRWLPETEEAMAKRAMHWPEDLTLGKWIDEGDEFDRMMRRGRVPGRPVADEDDTPPAGR